MQVAARRRLTRKAPDVMNNLEAQFRTRADQAQLVAEAAHRQGDFGGALVARSVADTWRKAADLTRDYAHYKETAI